MVGEKNGEMTRKQKEILTREKRDNSKIETKLRMSISFDWLSVLIGWDNFFGLKLPADYKSIIFPWS